MRIGRCMAVFVHGYDAADKQVFGFGVGFEVYNLK